MFFPLLLRVTLKFNETLDYYMRVFEDGTVEVGPRVLSLSSEETAWVLLHEIFHLFYRHFVRGKGYHKEVWDIAAELEINDTEPIKPLKRPKLVFTPWEVGLPSGKTAEYYYFRLLSDPKLLERVKRRMKDFPRYCGGMSRGQEEGHPDDEDFLLSLYIEGVMKTLTEKSIGNLPLTFRREVFERKKKTLWDEFLCSLRGYIVSEISSNYRWNFLRPSRRFESYPRPPRITPSTPQLYVVLDVSSSMRMREIEVCLQYIRGVVENFEGKVRVFSANVDIVEEIDPDGEIPLGGGTSMRQSLITLVKREGPAPIIVFTDGHTDSPAAEEILFSPLLWVVTDKSIDFVPLFGFVLFLPDLP